MDLCAYLLSAMGLTVLVVWPETGPSAWLRERVARRLLPGRAGELLDCYVCCGFWAALLLAPVWWWGVQAHWAWAGCLMVPGLFWVVLQWIEATRGTSDQSGDNAWDDVSS